MMLHRFQASRFVQSVCLHPEQKKRPHRQPLFCRWLLMGDLSLLSSATPALAATLVGMTGAEVAVMVGAQRSLTASASTRPWILAFKYRYTQQSRNRPFLTISARCTR